MAEDILFQSEITSLRLLQRGKVRDIYEVDDNHLLIVACDRISAFDVVLPTPIPGKGAVLTRLTDFWLERTRHLIPNHAARRSLASVLPDPAQRHTLEGRAAVVHRLEPLPVEAVVRGYLAGSGWRLYRDTGTLWGHRLPSGLREADALPEPLFTPSTKAAPGAHDEPMALPELVRLVGPDRAAAIEAASLALYREAAVYAADRGIIIADTKLEFGIDTEGRLTLMDEVLTPDSSRFWPADQWQPGTSPPSFDKQYVRDYLESIGWDKQPPAPHLPGDVVAQTAARYREADHRLRNATPRG